MADTIARNTTVTIVNRVENQTGGSAVISSSQLAQWDLHSEILQHPNHIAKNGRVDQIIFQPGNPIRPTKCLADGSPQH